MIEMMLNDGEDFTKTPTYTDDPEMIASTSQFP